MERYKAIAIPFLVIDGKANFLIVRDKRFREWTFVTGGCRRSEITNPLLCALRELEEETRGLINIKKGEYTTFRFKVADPCEPVMNVYDVFLLEYSAMTPLNQPRFIQDFNTQKMLMDNDLIRFRKQYDENDFIRFASIEDILGTSDVWSMIRKDVLENPEFYNALSSNNKTPFDINDSIERRAIKENPRNAHRPNKVDQRSARCHEAYLKQ
jgi:8-oxo-dGTP pyrophosphatase MutT (NUDIX family)